MTRTADVIVVGAGFAGLKAAQDLAGYGLSVILLEAKDRVGGRVKRGEVGGRIVDFGGQWIGARHPLLMAEAARLGIRAYPQYDAGRTVLELAGRSRTFVGEVPPLSPLALIEFANLQRLWDRDMARVPAEAPWTAARAELWDCITLEGWIAANLRTRAARAFARLVPRAAWAAEASQVSYLWFLDALRSGQGLAHLMGVRGGVLDAKFEGGMHAVTAGMAAGLGEAVVLSAPVRRIAQDETGVTAWTDRGEFRARFLVAAGPPGPFSRIEFDRPLPSRRDGLQQRMPMGAIIKLNLAYDRPFWREAGYSGQSVGDEDFLGITFDDVQETGPAILIGFIEGPRAMQASAMTRDERRERVLATLVRRFGPLAAEPLDYDDNDWTQEPWSHGYVGSMPPGVMTRYGQALREPVGRIHWAGTETAVEWAGYLEGALGSGAVAARQVLARHNEGPGG